MPDAEGWKERLGNGRAAGAVLRRLDRRRIRARGSDSELKPLARSRWETTEPEVGLTWGKEISGDAFVAKAASHGAFGPGKVVVEIGPGYGRIPDAVLGQGVEFAEYVGVDISPNNVEFLNKKYTGTPVRAVLGDAETVTLDVEPDTLLSSLTLKHLYPTFEVAFQNLSRQLKGGAILVFDVIEGVRQDFDKTTYVRRYTRDELRDILREAGLECAAFDTVEHDAEHHRLLVVARKPTA
jgi:SAM-dependent methyltransferase